MLTGLREAFDPGAQTQLDRILVRRNEGDEYSDLTVLSPSNHLFGLLVHGTSQKSKGMEIHSCVPRIPPPCNREQREDRRMYEKG